MLHFVKSQQPIKEEYFNCKERKEHIGMFLGVTACVNVVFAMN